MTPHIAIPSTINVMILYRDIKLRAELFSTPNLVNPLTARWPGIRTKRCKHESTEKDCPLKKIPIYKSAHN
jgi:hypothetical protein